MNTMLKKGFINLGLSLALIFSAVGLRPDGLIIIDKFPVDFIINNPARFNIKYHNVNVSINDQVATTSVDQVFENPYPYDLEGTYIFPIPEQANISDFTMYVNEKPLTAKIFSKEDTWAEYEKIVREKKDPALLEYIGRSMFKASIYPIPANGQLHISLKYSEILKADNGTVKYNYTLSTEKFSAKALDKASINVDIKSQQKILNVYSPTHKIDVKLDGTTNAQATYAEKNVRPDRDFILYYTLPNDDFGFNVLSYKNGTAKNGAEDGFFLAMMSPNCQPNTQQLVKKNILLVLDTSGSMYGAKLEQAKEALIFCLNHLNPDDKFNIISFDSSVKLYENNLINASAQNIAKAVAYVTGISSHGGTDINSALLDTLKLIEKDQAPTMIIFLTDGEPTVGECNIASIIKNVSSSNSGKVRLFSFGVGYDVNTKLLDKISLDNKGISEYIEPSEKIEEKISNFYLKISNPVLTDTALSFLGLQVNEIYPVELPDLFVGSQLLVVGRYKEGGKVQLCLSGKQNDVEKHFVFDTTFVDNQTENDFLPRIWAGRKIAYLIDQILLEGSKENLVNQIIELSRKYGIITEYTSFLITDGDAKNFSKEIVSDEMVQNSLASLSHASFDLTGKNAVYRAKSQQTLRDSSTEDDSYNKIIDSTTGSIHELFRTVRQRTFYLKDNIWIDSDHTDASPTVKIKIFSTEYFDLIKTYPDLGAALALGDKVIIKNGANSIFVCD